MLREKHNIEVYQKLENIAVPIVENLSGVIGKKISLVPYNNENEINSNIRIIPKSSNGIKNFFKYDRNIIHPDPERRHEIRKGNL